MKRMPSGWLIKSFVWLIWLFLTGCQGSDIPSKNTVEQASINAVNREQAPLIFAVPPYEMPSRIEERFKPLIQYLEGTLQRPIQFYIAASYSELIKKVAVDELDLAYMGPTPYVVARYKFGDAKTHVSLIAVEAPYVAAIVVHQNSPIDRVEQLKSHTMAFADYYSNTGHFAGRELMAEHEVHLSDLKLYDYLGRHERAILSVVHQDYDATTTSLGLAKRFIEQGYPLKIVAITKPQPPVAIVARPHLSQALRDKIQELLITPFDNEETLTKFGVFYPPLPSQYQKVYQSLKYFEAH